MGIRVHLHTGPASEPRCGRAPITHHGFEDCTGRPHPVTLPMRVDEAMNGVTPHSPAWYDLRTSLWDAVAARNLLSGHTVDEVSPLTGQLLRAVA